jgi:hypothetical protein
VKLPKFLKIFRAVLPRRKTADPLKVRQAPPSLPPDEDMPKNGRLTLLVAALFALMIGLGALNVKLIRDPSIARKAFGPIMRTKAPDAPKAPTQCDPLRSPRPRPSDVTFYDRLRGGDDSGSATEATQKAREDSQPSSPKPHEPKDDAGSKRASQKPVPASLQEVTLPQPHTGRTTYVVEVGSFSRPSIAQEWAERWKAKGYNVNLKPSAAKTGVSYRLYLGAFESEQQADELVKRLKAKEGITAMRLPLRE